jgi:hypothetical protein
LCSEVCIVDSNSETTVDERFSDPALDIHESGLNCAARIAKVELENKGEFYRISILWDHLFDIIRYGEFETIGGFRMGHFALSAKGKLPFSLTSMLKYVPIFQIICSHFYEYEICSLISQILLTIS